ncbi:hypothetical protein BJ165DRAFT_1396192 [Panaeolus papilionaceus]|nr:hypothetical protein BJ165DRAFT_1396192 [Panaeolus papilionaceus]
MANNEDNQQRKKRRLSDNDDLSTAMPAPFQGIEGGDAMKQGSIWFEDGSIILIVEKTQYRVHASLLSRCSSVFKDMFSLPQPTSSESGAEGCPVVHLHDSPQDVEQLLNAIYDSPHSADAAAPAKPMSLSTVSALLRLGNKYDIPHLRDHAISRLRLEYPLSYEGRNPINSQGYIINQRGRAFGIACLVYEEGVFSLLPLVLHYIVTAYNTKTILEYGIMANLPTALLHTCILGKENMATFMYTHSHVFLKDLKFIQCGQSWGNCKLSLHYFSQEILKPVPNLSYALRYDWTEIRAILSNRGIKFCEFCSDRFAECHEAGRKMVWDALPTFFGYQSWEAVKQMDRI